MRKMYIIVVISLSLLLSGCGRVSEPSAVKEKIDGSVKLAAGAWYVSSAEAWEREYLPEGLRASLFGEEEPDFPWVLYLGAESDRLCEILYALCHTEQEARSLAAVLSARIELFKKRNRGALCRSA